MCGVPGKEKTGFRGDRNGLLRRGWGPWGCFLTYRAEIGLRSWGVQLADFQLKK